MTRADFHDPIAWTARAVQAALAVAWLSDPFQVVAVASRLFAVFYAMQCVLAFMTARRERIGGAPARVAIAGLGAVSLAAALFGAPAG